MKVFFWNIEKAGQSSPFEKKAAMSDALWKVSKEFDLVLFAEMHSSRVKDFENFVGTVYTGFSSGNFKGGYSNNYCYLHNNQVTLENSPPQIGPRPLAVFSYNGVTVGMIHCKSGQLTLTKKEIESYSDWLSKQKNKKWALLGDLNWDFSKTGQLKLPTGAYCVKQWEQTQKKGGCLDWFVLSDVCNIKANTFRTFHNFLSTESLCMLYEDHKPIYAHFY